MKLKNKIPSMSECIGIVLAILIALGFGYMYIMIPYNFVILLSGKLPNTY